jgi:hypothetical protein
MPINSDTFVHEWVSSLEGLAVKTSLAVDLEQIAGDDFKLDLVRTAQKSDLMI